MTLHSSTMNAARATNIGAVLHARITELYPICRSITGPGVRQTLAKLDELVPIEVFEIPSGTPVLDWEVPKEWSIRDAWVKNSKGEKIVDFQAHNLSVVSYSTPVHTTMSLEELKPHLYTNPAYPDWIPYRTGYYAETWGFCLPHNKMLALEEDTYEVMVDSTLEPGALTYGECVVPGQTGEEIVVTAHTCHPSLANDNLSSLVIATELARRLLDGPQPKHTIRFVFIPGTIGSITWLAQNRDRVGRIRAGLVLANLGDGGPMHYKQSRRGAALVDRAAAHVLAPQDGHVILPFEPYGYDERQFCSPGFNLPFGCLSRTPYGQFPEYHTSADNLDLVQPAPLVSSLETLESILGVLDRDAAYLNRYPMGEPMLGRRGLYDAIGGQSDSKTRQLAMLWVLNQSDGENTLLDIAEKSGFTFAQIATVAETLLEHDLLEPCA